MKTSVKYIAFVMILFSLFVGKGAWALSGSNRVDFDGERLSVHAEGIPLNELLIAVSDLTDIEFRFDAWQGKRRFFLISKG